MGFTTSPGTHVRTAELHFGPHWEAPRSGWDTTWEPIFPYWNGAAIEHFKYRQHLWRMVLQSYWNGSPAQNDSPKLLLLAGTGRGCGRGVTFPITGFTAALVRPEIQSGWFCCFRNSTAFPLSGRPVRCDPVSYRLKRLVPDTAGDHSPSSG